MRKASFSFLPHFRMLFVSAIVVVMGAVAPAQASKYAAIVVDANTGKTIFASNADEPRFPASLTKMMTIYMAFEAMEAGKINKNTRVPFSAHAAARPPTKLGVRAGGSITVEAAIYSLVTRSANDAASALAELLGGTEANFGRLMTAKARRLGMTKTTFRNASGLPDAEQRTTARDMAILGLALRERYPQHYHYFSTRSYTFGKTRMGNHNKLLGRVQGVDGIKTGYIRASGFNLVSSVKTGGRSIVAVVMGGQSGASRDAHMADLIARHLPSASTRGSGPIVARRVIEPNANIAVAGAVALPRDNIPTPDFRPDVVAPNAVAKAPPADAAQTTAVAAFAPAATRPSAPVPLTETAAIDPVNTASTQISGWVVQVASSPSEQEARGVLSRTSERAGPILSGASPFTVPFQMDGTVYHRARFGGFSTKTAAWNACAALKKKKIDCYAVQQ